MTNQKWPAPNTSTLPTTELIDLQNALLHSVMRRHKYSSACDGCVNTAKVVKRLVGLS